MLADDYGGRSDNTLENSGRPLINMNPTYSQGNLFAIPSQIETVPPHELSSPKRSKMDQVSPYIIMPNDRLVFGWQYPLTNNMAETNTGPNDVFKNTMTLIGNSKLFLYGSLIKNGKEYHNNVNQQLCTPSLYENSFSPIITDRFQCATRNEYTGSYMDKFEIDRVNAKVGHNVTKVPTDRIGIYMGSLINSKISLQANSMVLAPSARGVIKDVQKFVSLDYNENYFDSVDIMPKAYFNFESYGQYIDFIEKSKDSKNKGLGADQTNYESPASVIFVKSEITDDISVKTYYESTPDELSVLLGKSFQSSNIDTHVTCSLPFFDDNLPMNRTYDVTGDEVVV